MIFRKLRYTGSRQIVKEIARSVWGHRENRRTLGQTGYGICVRCEWNRAHLSTRRKNASSTFNAIARLLQTCIAKGFFSRQPRCHCRVSYIRFQFTWHHSNTREETLEVFHSIDGEMMITLYYNILILIPLFFLHVTVTVIAGTNSGARFNKWCCSRKPREGISARSRKQARHSFAGSPILLL